MFCENRAVEPIRHFAKESFHRIAVRQPQIRLGSTGYRSNLNRDARPCDKFESR